jgi:LysR family transcriptional regulator, glycine cleavage system transcriptional activator
MRNLEADLGIALFERHGPRVTPTEAACSIARKTADALQLMHSAVDEFRFPRTALRITAVPSFTTRWLAPRLARFQALPNAPAVSLDVSLALRDPSTFDVAIRTGNGQWPGLDATSLFPVEATPMLRADLAREIASPVDLAHIPLIPHPDWKRWFSEAGYPDLPPSLSDDSYPTHEVDAAAALAGAGAALLSPVLYDELLRDGQLVRPFSQALMGPDRHYLLLNEGEQRPAVALFKEWILAEAAHSLR